MDGECDNLKQCYHIAIQIPYTEMKELRLVKILLTCIGHSGSDRSAFYLYRATNTGLSSIPYYVHAQVSKMAYVRLSAYPAETTVTVNAPKTHGFLVYSFHHLIL